MAKGGSFSLPIMEKYDPLEEQKYTLVLTYEIMSGKNTLYEGVSMADKVRIQVLMDREEASRFEDYCRDQGFKKSTLIARLIREHLNREHFKMQRDLFQKTANGSD
jgi:hypothetical protein